MSVDLGSELDRLELPVESVMVGHDGFSLAAITALLARENGQGIVRKPLPGDPAHAEVFGRKTDSIRGKFARGAVWVIPPVEQTPDPL